MFIRFLLTCININHYNYDLLYTGELSKHQLERQLTLLQIALGPQTKQYIIYIYISHV